MVKEDLQIKRDRKTPTLFRYPGGKFYALNILAPFWQGIQHDEYREPFVGGGSVFFSKNKVQHNWLNDKDHELITTYQHFQGADTRARLIEKFEKEVASKERWREVFETKTDSDFDVAFKYYYLNRTSFSGKLASPAWGYRPKRSLPPERWKERILPCGQKLEGVKITSIDFEGVINAPTQGNKTLLFVDPPYYSPPKKKHYRNGFSLDDHHRLAETLKKTSHAFFLTYDDVQGVKDLYQWANIYEVKFFYRVDNSNTENGSRKMGFELVITNYELPKQISLFSH